VIFKFDFSRATKTLDLRLEGVQKIISPRRRHAAQRCVYPPRLVLSARI